MGEDLKTLALLAALREAVTAGRPVVLATVIDTHRSVPRHAGSKMLVYADGSILGSIGGGEMEGQVKGEAARALGDGRPRLLTYQLVDPRRGDVGVCGGEVTIYLEAYMPAATVAVVGTGHIGRAVVELADWLGFSVIAYDDRPDQVEAAAVPKARLRITGRIEDLLPHITSETHVTVVTRNMAVDLELLPALLASPARSIGVMGSRRRWELTKEALLEKGVAPAVIDRVWAPIGLEINAESPEEIALSIIAEIVHHRRQDQSDAAP